MESRGTPVSSRHSSTGPPLGGRTGVTERIVESMIGLGVSDAVHPSGLRSPVTLHTRPSTSVRPPARISTRDCCLQNALCRATRHSFKLTPENYGEAAYNSQHATHRYAHCTDAYQ